jgi:uncharacterized membrane protein YjjP (DUF1212 family)
VKSTGCHRCVRADALVRITIATILSFVSAALANAHFFCYSAVASSSVVLILPVSDLRLPFNPSDR